VEDVLPAEYFWRSSNRCASRCLFHAIFAVCLIHTPVLPARLIPANHPEIRYTGRFDFSDPLAVRFDWPGAQIQAAFTGTSLRVRMRGNADAFDATIDDNEPIVFRLDPAITEYTIADGLTDTIHSVRIVKRFEGRLPVAFMGLSLDNDAQIIPLPPRPPYRIEFIGGSLLTGFGVESHTIRCEDYIDSSNTDRAFGSVVARMLNAEHIVVAMTGKGLMRDWGAPSLVSPEPFGSFYGRTLRNCVEPRWEFSSWIPHAVVINQGINDYSTTPHAPRGVFIARYRNLIATVKRHYGEVKIVCLASPREPLRTIIEDIVEMEKADGNSDVHFLCYKAIPNAKRGCDWHPNEEGHAMIADTLAAFLRTIDPRLRKGEME